MQAEGATKVAGDNEEISRDRTPVVTENANKTSGEAITSSTTAMVAEAISKTRKHDGRPNAPEETKPCATSTSEIAGDIPSAQAHADDQRVGSLADPGSRTTPRTTKSGGDLRSSFLAAVGNTISQTEPLGVPKINPDESSSSSEEESQPPVQLLRRNRRASSITRAGNMALSLSSTKPSAAADASSPANTSSPTAAEESPASASADGRVSRVQFNEMDESVKRLLLISPAYPGGICGRMTMDRSSPASRSPPSPSGGDTSGNKRKRYKMVFDEDRDKQTSATAADEPRHDPAGAATAWRGLPAGLEAVPHETDPTMLCVRELGPAGASEGGGVSGGSAGRVVAQIGATATVAGGRESIHSVVLATERNGGGVGVTRELMAVRVSTHPTRLAAPREVQAVLLLPRDREDLGRGTHAQGMSGMPVWDSGSASRSDGLWEAAAAGRVGGEAAAVVELHSKAAMWSPTTKSFELDVLEAWRPGQIDVGRAAAAAAGAVTSSQPAPETMQMVSTPDGNLSSARSGNSSARGGAEGRHERRRIPSVQLARLKNTSIGDSSRVEGGGSSEDVDGNNKRTSSEGDRVVSSERASGGPADAIYEFSWAVAVAAPVPPLHGFCLAVVGLETGMVGAAVTLVDRSVEAAAEQAAVGFLGFDEALTQDGKGSPTARDGILPTSARIEQQQEQQEQQSEQSQRKDESNRSGKDLGIVPAVPPLALGVMAATAKASGSGRRSSASRSSRRPSPGRSGREIGDNRSDPQSDRNPTASSRADSNDSLKNNPTSTFQKSSVDREAGAAGRQQVGGLAEGDIKGGGRGDEGKAAVAGPDRQPMVPVGGVAWAATTGGTVPVPVKRRMSVQVAAAKIVEKVYRNTYVCNLCLLTLTVSFTADLYPGAPSHNVPMSAALLWACSNVDGVRALRRRSFAYALSVVVLLSLFMDIDFLASDLKAYALSQLEEEDDDLQRVIVEKNMHTFGRIIVGIVAGLKALSWQGLLATSPQGIHALNLLWRRFKLFLPIWGSPRKLTKEVYNRVVALAWLHLLAAVALMIMAGVAGMGFEWAPQFASSQGAGIPLAAISFLKSLTSLLVSAALFRNMDLALCLNVFGCLACFQGWHLAREQRRRARHGVTYPKVVLEWDYIMMCGYVKIFDLLLGIWLWIGLGWAWNEDRDYSERHNVRMLLMAITTVQTLTDVWSVFLGIAVSLLVSQYLLRKEKSAAAAKNAFGEEEGLDRDVEIARSLSTGRLLASPASPTSPDSSSSKDGGRRGGGKNDDDLESSDDSYSTGESDTESDESPPRSRKPARTSAVGVQLGEVPGSAVGSGGRGNVNNATTAVVVATAQPAQGAWPPGNATVGSSRFGEAAPRRRSMFAPGGNRLVYKRAFSARSSSDDSVVGGENNSSGGIPPPEAISLDRSFVTTADDFSSAWDSLRTCASFRCRIGRLPEAETLAVHFREQGFVVVASGVVGDGRTKIYACARGVGVEALFYAELVFEKEMHELAFTFKCQDERLTSRFVCHMHLRRVIGDHQPIA